MILTFVGLVRRVWLFFLCLKNEFGSSYIFYFLVLLYKDIGRFILKFIITNTLYFEKYNLLPHHKHRSIENHFSSRGTRGENMKGQFCLLIEYL